MVTQEITIRGKKLKVASNGSKADIARALLDQGYTVSEISKAVPMAYSQVHSVAAKRNPAEVVKAVQDRKSRENQAPKPMPSGKYHRGLGRTRMTDEQAATWDPAYADIRPKGSRVKSPKREIKVGKLRTPGMPTDIRVGPCANCDYEIVVRRGSSGYMLIHTGMSTEEYLSTIQFCQAVPASLL